MDALLFDLPFLLAVPFWALMVLAPKWRISERVVSSPLVAAAPAVIYAIAVIPRFGEVLRLVLSPELTSAAAFFGTPIGTVIAWAHFIALDLMLGRWIYLDSRARRLSALVVSPILVLTILLAPLGLLAYLVIRVLPISRRPHDSGHAQGRGTAVVRADPLTT